MSTQVMTLVREGLLIGAFVVALGAVLEKLANVMGYSLAFLGGYVPSRLLELAAIALLFVIALQLRDIRRAQGEGAKGP